MKTAEENQEVDSQLDVIYNYSLVTSLTQMKKRTSTQVIFNISNTMMGTSLLVIPCNFYKYGIVSSSIIALIMVLISYITCNLVIIHTRDDEYDFPLALRRLLGKKGETAFNFVSFLLLLLICIIHFILQANILYCLIINISGKTENVPKFDDITFKEFSMQYVGIILFIICGLLYCIKKIKYILILNDKGIYMIFLFSLYIIYLGIKAMATKDISFAWTGQPGVNKRGLEMILFDTDLLQVIGVFSLAYGAHNNVAGMMNNCKHPEKRSRDLFFAYLLVLVYYLILGIFGSFAVAALYNGQYDTTKNPNDILILLSQNNDFQSWTDRFLGLLALLFVFFQLITVLPILNFFTRRQFYGLFLGSDVERLSNMKIHLFNIVFNVICLGFEIFVFEPVIVISYTGAIGAYMIIYFLPIACHLKCLYFTNYEQIETRKISNNTIEDFQTLNDSTQKKTKKENEKERERETCKFSSENNEEKELYNSKNMKKDSKEEDDDAIYLPHKLFTRKSSVDESDKEMKYESCLRKSSDLESSFIQKRKDSFLKDELKEILNNKKCRNDFTHENTPPKIIGLSFYGIILLIGTAICFYSLIKLIFKI